MKENIAVIGCAFGDEAKARCVHWMAKDFRFVVRFGGSLNAGHTIYHDGKKIVRHMIPSADFSVGNKAFLGSGMVLDIPQLLKEVIECEKQFPGSAKNIYVDPDAFIITQEHIEEDANKNKHIGSTGKGVGPAYKDKIGRTGIRLQSLIDSGDYFIKSLQDKGVQFKSCIELCDEFDMTNGVIFEGSQAIMLDISFGTYPFVTSGETGLAGIINSGFAKYMPKRIYGIVKAYSTRVGNGPFATEIDDSEEIANYIRAQGKEYGASTGRPRRIGWLDLPSIKYAAEKAAITDLIVTKLDVLDGFNEIYVCDQYLDGYPRTSSDIINAKPFYHVMPGWKNSKSIEQTKDFRELIEQTTRIPISHISCGVNEEDIITLRD